MADMNKDLFNLTLKKAEKIHKSPLPNVRPIDNGIEVVCPEADNTYWTNLMSKAFEEARTEYLQGAGYGN